MANCLEGYGTDNLVVAETDNFVAIPSLGPLAVGHSLIVTREHEPNVILYAARENRWMELHTLIIHLNNILADRIDETDFVLFEHGSVVSTQNICSTDHAHLHVVPIPISFFPALKEKIKETFAAVTCAEMVENGRLAGEFISVLLVNNSQEKNNWFFLPGRDVPSQFMRQFLARILNLEHWDWKMNPASDLFRKTVELYLASAARRTNVSGFTQHDDMNPASEKIPVMGLPCGSMKDTATVGGGRTNAVTTQTRLRLAESDGVAERGFPGVALLSWIPSPLERRNPVNRERVPHIRLSIATRLRN